MFGLVLGYADAILEGSGEQLPTVASELAAFSEILAGSGELRGALANGTVQPAKRRAIVQELLAKRVSAPTLDLLTFAVQSGAGADYPADVAGMAALADARRRGMVPVDDGALGRTAAAERLDGYATGVLVRLEKRQLGNVEDELFRFMRIVEGNDELRVALTTAELPADVRERVVDALLSPRAAAETARLARYAASAGRPRDYLVLLDGLVERVAKEADRRVADVRSAAEMTQQDQARLAAALSGFTGYKLDVRVTVEPGLLGGFVATVGDMVVDASLRHRLEMAKQNLFASPGGGQA